MWRSTFVSETIFNYVAINKDLEKFPPQLYKIKMKICCDQGYNDIGVAIETNWCITVFTWSRIFQHFNLFFQNRARELLLPIAASMFVKFKQNL